MKIGDLVKLVTPASGTNPVGQVYRIDKDHHGSGQALKIYKEVPRGNAVRSDMVDGIGPTRRGKRDRILVLWNMEQWGYAESDELKVVK